LKIYAVLGFEIGMDVMDFARNSEKRFKKKLQGSSKI
jgi:hypothetical protein